MEYYHRTMSKLGDRLDSVRQKRWWPWAAGLVGAAVTFGLVLWIFWLVYFVMIASLILLAISHERSIHYAQVSARLKGRMDMLVALQEAIGRGMSLEEWALAEAERDIRYSLESMPPRQRRKTEKAIAKLGHEPDPTKGDEVP